LLSGSNFAELSFLQLRRLHAHSLVVPSFRFPVSRFSSIAQNGKYKTGNGAEQACAPPKASVIFKAVFRAPGENSRIKRDLDAVRRGTGPGLGSAFRYTYRLRTFVVHGYFPSRLSRQSHVESQALLC
jgi:hypothetical protein